MKQQRFRYRMLAFLTIGLLVAAGVALNMVLEHLLERKAAKN